MVRPPKSDPEATVNAILNAVGRLLETHAIPRLSLRAIAREARVGLGTLTYYFPNREKLMEAALQSYYRETLALRDELLGSLDDECAARSVDDLLRELGGRLYRALCERKRWLALEQFLNQARGATTRAHQENWLAPSLDRAVSVLAPLTGRSAREIRLGVQSLVFTAMRYATLDRDGLAVVLGIEPAEVPQHADARVEAHLGELTRSLLGDRR